MIAPENDEQFNPYCLDMTARIPVALFSYPRLSCGAKLLYSRLALFRGRKQSGFCAPNLETLSQAMAVSSDTIERWLDELVTEGFIVRKRRRRAAAECVFLPHPCFFESAKTPNQEVRQDSAETRNQRSVLDSATTRLRFRKSAPLDSADLPPPYKEENHSSSKPFTENQEDALECRFDDDENHSLRHAHGGPQLASPEAELREIFRSKTGDEISRDVEQRIWEAVEVRGVTRIEFIAELWPHVQNAWHNPAGFLTDFAKKIHSKKAGSSQATVTGEISRQIPETERCPICRAGYTRYDEDPAVREYCKCTLGLELKRMDARIAAKASSQPETAAEPVRATGTEAVETTL